MRGTTNGPGTSPARLAFAILIALQPLGCSDSGGNREGAGQVHQTIEQVLARRTPELMSIEGVQGVGQALCSGTPCIRVYLFDEAARARLPRQLDGYPVTGVVTGTIRPLTGE
jgi:hypothetical protein